MRKLIFTIINYNDISNTIQLFNNIKNYKIIDKIYIVDNCSTDNSYSELKKLKSDKLKLIRTDKNKGFAYALNISAHDIIKEYGNADIVFSNADIIINSNEDLVELKKTLQDKNIGLVAPVVYQNKSLNRGWKIPRPVDEILGNLPYVGRFFIKRNLYKEKHYNTHISEVDVLSFCFFLIKTETLEKIKFFDENTFLYYEENITAIKLKKTNYKSVINNDICIIHNHSATIDKNINYINKYKILKQSQIYFEKNYNNANKLEFFFLKLTIKLTLITLYVRIFIRGGLKK